ncbi:MAG: hypothetical protein ABI446_15325 [Gemmatimonadaceae bacterium]
MLDLTRVPLLAVIAAALTFGSKCSNDASSSANTAISSASNSQGTTSGIEANLTDLPTYPNLTAGKMMGHPPKQGALYNAKTNDSYEQVVGWYRSKLTGATEGHSGYVDGKNGKRETEFHLSKWNEQVSILADSSVKGTLFTLGQDAH